METTRKSKQSTVTSAGAAQLDTRTALLALAALAQETRLSIFRLLIAKGPEGMQVGAIADALQLANATLSFHLKELSNARLLIAAPNGRAIIYSANLATMNALVAYLTENCCAGATCTSVVDCAPLASTHRGGAGTKSIATARRTRS